MIHLQRAGLLVNIATETEDKCGQESMRNHHQHRPGHSDEVERCDAEKHKAHVGHTRITRQPIKILLPHCHPAAIDQVAEAEPGHDRHPALGRIGQHGQGNPNETVQAELFKHPRMKHRGRTRR